MNDFIIDSDGILWVRGEGEVGFACTGLPSRPGEEESVWATVPDGYEM